MLQLIEQYGEDNSVDYEAFVEISVFFIFFALPVLIYSLHFIVKDKFSKRNPEDEMRKAHALFADEHTGTITIRQLKKIAKELGDDVPDSELQAMIDEFDLDHDGASLLKIIIFS